MSEIVRMFSYHFMQRAFIVGILVSVCAAVLGVSLVLKKYSMIGDGLSHVGFGALAVASAFGWAPLWVAVPVVIAAAIVLLSLQQSSKVRGDSAIAIISSASLAIGVITVSLTTGMNTEVSSYMFGSILSLSRADTVLSVLLSVIVLIIFILFYPRIFAVTFDETFAKATGTDTKLYNMLLAILTAVTVVLGMRMMGAMLISSLIVFPALSAMRVCRNFKSVVLTSALISVSCFVLGITASFFLETPTGASIVVADLAVFGLLTFISGRK